MNKKLYLGLVHFPVYNKNKEIVTTSITNFDIHDISRSCQTFGVKKFFIINPLKSQKDFLNRILHFWKKNKAINYNQFRVHALSIIEYSKCIDSAINKIKNKEVDNPLIITTTANTLNKQIDINKLKTIKTEKPLLFLFGTGNGLTQGIHDNADYVLKPIAGKNSYNHLSVRSAVAIILDRFTS